MRIVCVGDCGIDHYLPGNRKLVGGITANFARHAVAVFPHGDEISVISCIGNDTNGRIVREDLAAHAFDCQILEVAGDTPVQYIEVRDDGEKVFVRYESGVLAHFSISSGQQRTIDEADVLVMPVYVQITHLFEQVLANARPAQTAIDFADFRQHPDFDLLEQYLDRVDIGFFGLTRADVSLIGRLQAIARQRDKIFVVTLGADGGQVLAGDQQLDFEAVQVPGVVDTTGAGDAFAAGFLSLYCHGANMVDAVRQGARLAGKVVQDVGGWTSEVT